MSMVGERRRAGTLRLRITISAASVVALGLLVTAIVFVNVIRRDLVRSVDTGLEQAVAELVALLDDTDSLVANLDSRVGDEFLAQVSEAGNVVAASPNVAELSPLGLGELEDGAFDDLSGIPVDDGSYRMHRVDADGTTIIVGQTLDEVRDGVAIVTSALLVGVPILTLGLAALVWILVGRTLRPVEAIRSEVAEMGRGTQLDRRVPVPPTRDEISRLAITMNDMLARVERSTERQRAFVADASHELRIPLTRLRTQLEVEIAGRQPTPSVGNLLEEVIILQRMVEDLLYLARADAGTTTLATFPLDLDEVVREEARRFEGLELDLQAVMVDGHREHLGRLIRNLLDNAARHTRTVVRVRLRGASGRSILSVTDNGSGIPIERRETVFERFSRLDDARTASDGGTGLGLAIARDIVERHDGTIEIGDADPGAVVTVDLPALG